MTVAAPLGVVMRCLGFPRPWQSWHRLPVRADLNGRSRTDHVSVGVIVVGEFCHRHPPFLGAAQAENDGDDEYRDDDGER